MGVELKTMVDYVVNFNHNKSDNVFEYVHLIEAYANFLNQKPELWMFVPVDEEGKLMKPPHKAGFLGSQEMQYSLYKRRYDKSLDKVIFEGFEVVNANFASKDHLKLVYDELKIATNLIRGQWLFNGVNSIEELISKFPKLKIKQSYAQKLGLI